MDRILARLLGGLLGLAVILPPPVSLPFAPTHPLVTLAHADDDDDGGGDDDDDDDGGGGRSDRGGSGGSGDRAPPRQSGFTLFPFLQSPRPAPVRRAAPAAIPDRVPNEIIAAGLSEAAITQLTTEGYAVAERQSLALLATEPATEIVRLVVPRGTGLDAARARVAALAPVAQVDFNHYYRPEQTETAPDCGGQSCALVREIIGWPLDPAGLVQRCGSLPKIGLIDTAINPAHPSLDKARLEVIRISDDALPQSGRQHGTAVAALLVGAAGSRAPGLLPSSEVIAVDAFRRLGGSADVASTFDLVRALDALSSRNVRVINLSLAGPDNLLLKRTVEAMIARGAILVAAVGNAGPRAKPLYPAGYEGVIAVTAVDKGRKAYRRANQGAHVDIAAPGVNVWTAASISGARPKSGTSFAAPFVSAAAAVLLAERPELTPAQMAEALSLMAQDIGTPGRDSVFGWGLLDARRLCTAEASAAP
ncbi:S8 family serine peptidase [Rhizobium sp. WL3]|uniref:S8 family serine peptidase n=1 Tax=Rhizobium sp. WL3 TaxID=2603277 RepID=UPI0011C1F496|nr:S8 family serine peptidase [Rhizobium sp. WL3]QEE46084.1 S8 family serine peptidase [Rhizobium sp. WL3]